MQLVRGRKLCTMACPYGPMFYDADTTKRQVATLRTAARLREACPTQAINGSRKRVRRLESPATFAAPHESAPRQGACLMATPGT